MRRVKIGVMGPGRAATQQECEVAHQMGKLIAESGHDVLTGGVAHGVMDAASQGACEAGGLVIGILPYKEDSETHPVSKFVHISIPTNMGEGRNVINALSSDVVVVIGKCPGTMTEVWHAIKNGKPIVFMLQEKHDGRPFRATGWPIPRLCFHDDSEAAIVAVNNFLSTI